jgi:phosphoenolpyruvate carboxykinase (ATP)
LSGTGKTTSRPTQRTLIGDDEHGWSDDGVFNFEGGCYAKVIRLSRRRSRRSTPPPALRHHPRERRARRRHPPARPRRRPLTENTRAPIPSSHIPNVVPRGPGGHPKNIIMLTADAFGVLPPIARLTPEQAMYHFLSGYTAKVAGTEKGITEPSGDLLDLLRRALHGAPPSVYAKLLGEKISRHGANCWLVNTGWTGGRTASAPIEHTRALLAAALEGSLADVAFEQDPVFGIEVPSSCPGVPAELLRPRGTWSDPEAYDAKARELAGRFHANFEQFEGDASPEIRNAGPLLR